MAGAVLRRHGARRPARRRRSSPRPASRRPPTTGGRWTVSRCTKGRRPRFALVDATNEFIAATAPWTLAKDPANADRAHAGAVRRRGSDPPRGRAADADHARRRRARFCGGSAPAGSRSASIAMAGGATRASARWRRKDAVWPRLPRRPIAQPSLSRCDVKTRRRIRERSPRPEHRHRAAQHQHRAPHGQAQHPHEHQHRHRSTEPQAPSTQAPRTCPPSGFRSTTS